MYDYNTLPFQPANHQDHEEGLDCPAGGWVYLCCRCIGSFSHMAPPPPPHAAPCMRNCCCHSGGQSTVAVADPPKEPEKFSVDNKPAVRVYCKSLVKYSLTIRNGKLTLAPTNTSDPHQKWIKEEKFGKKVKDEKGNSSFALINKATGQAIKHSIGVTYPVQLIKYDPYKLDESVLWTWRGVQGYSAIRPVYDIYLNLDAYDCTKDLEKTNIRQYGWNGGGNQLWNLAFFLDQVHLHHMSSLMSGSSSYAIFGGHGHPETVVAFYTMSSVNSQCLLRYPTRSLGKIKYILALVIWTGLQLGRVPIGQWLGRPDKKLTMLFLVGGLTNLSLGWVEHFAKEYKSMGLAVEIVNFYQGRIHKDAWIYNQYGRDELYKFAKLCNGNDSSRYVEVKHGSDISDVLSKTLLKDTPCHPAAAAAVADDEARGSKQRDDIDRRIYNGMHPGC
uniref:uncharacterized protein LOC122604473 n=1 Tax=Erigeron canadensis TaxID=72917 RepID=UPI001CB9A2C6|nr:uncharacterized protein LOC122604473 [Erigeron canadensis]